MRKDRKRQVLRKRLSAIVSISLALLIFLTGTFAWQDYKQHKSNEFKTKGLDHNVVLVEDFEVEDEWSIHENGGFKEKIAYVRNGQDNNVDVDNAVVRVSLKEYMELHELEYEYSTERFMLDKQGEFIRVEKIDQEASADTIRRLENRLSSLGISSENNLNSNNIKLLQGFFDSQEYWYIITEKNDPNGQYGKHLPLERKYVNQSPTKPYGDAKQITFGQGRVLDSTLDDKHHSVGSHPECEYPAILWQHKDQYSDINELMLHQDVDGNQGPDAGVGEYVSLAMETDDFITYDEWQSGNQKPVRKWILATSSIDPNQNGYMYWGEVLTGGQETKKLLSGTQLLKQPEDSAYYNLHIDMQAFSLDDMPSDVPEDLEEMYKGQNTRAYMELNSNVDRIISGEHFTIDYHGRDQHDEPYVDFDVKISGEAFDHFDKDTNTVYSKFGESGSIYIVVTPKGLRSPQATKKITVSPYTIRIPELERINYLSKPGQTHDMKAEPEHSDYVYKLSSQYDKANTKFVGSQLTIDSNETEIDFIDFDVLLENVIIDTFRLKLEQIYGVDLPVLEGSPELYTESQVSLDGFAKGNDNLQDNSVSYQINGTSQGIQISGDKLLITKDAVIGQTYQIDVIANHDNSIKETYSFTVKERTHSLIVGSKQNPLKYDVEEEIKVADDQGQEIAVEKIEIIQERLGYSVQSNNKMLLDNRATVGDVEVRITLAEKINNQPIVLEEKVYGSVVTGVEYEVSLPTDLARNNTYNAKAKAIGFNLSESEKEIDYSESLVDDTDLASINEDGQLTVKPTAEVLEMFRIKHVSHYGAKEIESTHRVMLHKDEEDFRVNIEVYKDEALTEAYDRPLMRHDEAYLKHVGYTVNKTPLLNVKNIRLESLELVDKDQAEMLGDMHIKMNRELNRTKIQFEATLSHPFGTKDVWLNADTGLGRSFLSATERIRNSNKRDLFSLNFEHESFGQISEEDMEISVKSAVDLSGSKDLPSNQELFIYHDDVKKGEINPLIHGDVEVIYNVTLYGTEEEEVRVIYDAAYQELDKIKLGKEIDSSGKYKDKDKYFDIYFIAEEDAPTLNGRTLENVKKNTMLIMMEYAMRKSEVSELGLPILEKDYDANMTPLNERDWLEHPYPHPNPKDKFPILKERSNKVRGFVKSSVNGEPYFGMQYFTYAINPEVRHGEGSNVNEGRPTIIYPTPSFKYNDTDGEVESHTGAKLIIDTYSNKFMKKNADMKIEQYILSHQNSSQYNYPLFAHPNVQSWLNHNITLYAAQPDGAHKPTVSYKIADMFIPSISDFNTYFYRYRIGNSFPALGNNQLFVISSSVGDSLMSLPYAGGSLAYMSEKGQLKSYGNSALAGFRGAYFINITK